MNVPAGRLRRINYTAIDSYSEPRAAETDSIEVQPSHKQVPLVAGQDFFFGPYRAVLANSFYEFEINRQFHYATLGRIKSGRGFCFFAGGTPTPSTLTSGTVNLTGYADGLAVIGGDDRRLFGSPATATLTFASGPVFPTGTLNVTIELRARDNPFGHFMQSPDVPLGTATAQLTLFNHGDIAYFAGSRSESAGGTISFTNARLTGPGGSAGDISGLLLKNNSVALAFDLAFPNGDRAIGVVNVEL